jgi:ribosomal protein S18 acetylase RimI-like enzyme
LVIDIYSLKIKTLTFEIKLTMMPFSNEHIAIATMQNISCLNTLLNEAYRGESSKQGWTSEAHLITGETRINVAMLQQVMEKPGSVILIYTNDDNKIKGCVNLQQHDDKLYLGLLAVSPQLQGAGVGKQLLKASEEYAHSVQCSAIYMTVISLRTELINWYIRHGYTDTGKRRHFEEDAITGKHLQPLEFMVLEKVV